MLVVADGEGVFVRKDYRQLPKLAFVGNDFFLIPSDDFREWVNLGLVSKRQHGYDFSIASRYGFEAGHHFDQKHQNHHREKYSHTQIQPNWIRSLAGKVPQSTDQSCDQSQQDEA